MAKHIYIYGNIWNIISVKKYMWQKTSVYIIYIIIYIYIQYIIKWREHGNPRGAPDPRNDLQDVRSEMRALLEPWLGLETRENIIVA